MVASYVQEQLLDLVQQYYTTLILQDDNATSVVDKVNDEDDQLTLYVSSTQKC